MTDRNPDNLSDNGYPGEFGKTGTKSAELGCRLAHCLCGETDTSPFLTVGKKLLVRCTSCRLIFTADFRSDPDLYTGSAYFTGPSGYIEREDTFRVLFETLVEKIKKFKPSGSLLDVGTGIGSLMEVASEIGFSTMGVEVSEWASSYARKERSHDVVTGTLEGAGFADTSFDVIVLNHVLEHVETPKSLLAEIWRILKNDGILAIGVPNAASLMATLLGARWASWRPEQHMWHFTPDTLSALLKSGGFDVIHWEARENSIVDDRGMKGLLQGLINAVAAWTNRSEAMLFISRKRRPLRS